MGDDVAVDDAVGLGLDVGEDVAVGVGDEFAVGLEVGVGLDVGMGLDVGLGLDVGAVDAIAQDSVSRPEVTVQVDGVGGGPLKLEVNPYDVWAPDATVEFHEALATARLPDL